MASGRGQSHFNVTDFLQPFLDNLELIRYPLNLNTQNTYYKEKSAIERDMMSYLPICSYSNGKGKQKPECKLFEPVITGSKI